MEMVTVREVSQICLTTAYMSVFVFFFLKCIALPERKLGVASEEPIPDVSVLVSFEKKHRLWSLFYGSPNKVALNQAGLISGFP